MMDMEPWEVWVRRTDLHFFVLRNPWMWPLCETIHYIGLSLLLGTVGLFDLRARVAKGIAPYTIHRLIRWGIAGFANASPASFSSSATRTNTPKQRLLFQGSVHGHRGL
jgi:hypothetical protein